MNESFETTEPWVTCPGSFHGLWYWGLNTVPCEYVSNNVPTSPWWLQKVYQLQKMLNKSKKKMTIVINDICLATISEDIYHEKKIWYKVVSWTRLKFKGVCKVWYFIANSWTSIIKKVTSVHKRMEVFFNEKNILNDFQIFPSLTTGFF